MGAELKPIRDLGAWSRWRTSEAYTLGVEEEVMLLAPPGGGLAQRGDDVLLELAEPLAGRVSGETHQAALELTCAPHETVAAVEEELADLRSRLHDSLAALGLGVAAAGVHPFTPASETEVSPAGRYQLILRTMRELARREPTFALHVHVGVPDPEDAVRLMNRLRVHLPLLLAVSANSPFRAGRATGFASTRTTLFQAFPRTGIPRSFASYEDWVSTVGLMLRCGAFPEATFLWWDVRAQPRFGTVEVRVMDAQTDVARVGALVALVQALARLELEEGFASSAQVHGDEILAENRFLAARDGMDAELLEPDTGRRRPARALLAELLDAVRPHAEALGGARRLALLERDEPGYARQRSVAARAGGLRAVVADLAGRFRAA
ncbi:MAG TPA: YbdK family carboxylate-amine ligase [Solirubrobacteraceae bacterium]|nr:YbdK family carboxylate-amine ligase [Solirubrobacteraceae bacterium]